jgi:hypothetical protein
MTCQDLLLENHIAHMKTLCHERGLNLAIEPYDMNPANDLDLGSYADIPMGEFWHNGFNSAFSCIEAASIGHVMGKRRGSWGPAEPRSVAMVNAALDSSLR